MKPQYIEITRAVCSRMPLCFLGKTCVSVGFYVVGVHVL